VSCDCPWQPPALDLSLDEDYKAYLDRLEKYRGKFEVKIYAYSLMPNHVHLLLETSSPRLKCSRHYLKKIF
jgi:REP element-mobilizing transposase RayT